jgi:hypothetical protein
MNSNPLPNVGPRWSAKERGTSASRSSGCEGKVTKNRVHIDLSAADENEEAARIEGLGATRLWVSDKPDDPFIVLADPEGNEFCVVRQGDEKAAPSSLLSGEVAARSHIQAICRSISTKLNLH